MTHHGSQEIGVSCRVNHVAVLVRERGLRARNGKGFKYVRPVQATTQVKENLLAQDFTVEAANQKWVSDITQFKVGRTWLFPVVVMDLYSRKIVCWTLDTHARETRVLDAFTMAVSRRNITDNQLTHSDRGVQYPGNEYQQALADSKMRCSMSRKGNCCDKCNDGIILPSAGSRTH